MLPISVFDGTFLIILPSLSIYASVSRTLDDGAISYSLYGTNISENLYPEIALSKFPVKIIYYTHYT